MFKVDYSEVKEVNGIIAEGFYEVVVNKAELAMTKNGVEHINMWLTIRNDVDQSFKNAIIFNKMWKSKETDNYMVWQLQAVSKAVQLEEGKEYSSIEDWLEALINRIMRVKVVHEEYDGEPQAKVKSYQESKNPTCNHKWEKGKEPVVNSGFQVVEDEDLPF